MDIFIHNQPEGMCASIAFYQMCSLLKGIEFNDLMKYMKRKVGNGIEFKYFNDYLKNLYYAIQTGSYSPEDLPKCLSETQFQNPIEQLGTFGTSLYGIMNLFDRMLYLVQTGIDIGYADSIEINHYIRSLNNSLIDGLFSDWSEWVIQHKAEEFDGVPYITFDLFLDENDIIEESKHVLVSVYYPNEGNLILDSNKDKELYLKDFSYMILLHEHE